MVLSKDRCCVAVPLYNVGIYAILGQFAVISLVTAVLSFAAPYIVAVSVPGFGSYLLGALCLIVFALQGWGFFGVYKEKPATYRKYVRVNTIAVALAFIMAVVWIALSAANHNKSVTRCVEQFITDSDSTSTTTDSSSLVNVSADTVSGHTLCSVFTWVQTGVMGGLWLALLLVEIYFVLMSRVYGTEQRQDHMRYNSIYTEQRESYIRQSMLWDQQRNSQDGMDPAAPPQFSHGRSFSTVSKSSALRNEVKVPGAYDYADNDDDAGNTSRDAFMDQSLYAPSAGQSPYDRPNSAYSTNTAQFANSRSNLAPENTSPAYVHSRNQSNLSLGQGYGQPHQQQQQHLQMPYPGQPQHQHKTSRSSQNDVDDFSSYYAT